MAKKLFGGKEGEELLADIAGKSSKQHITVAVTTSAAAKANNQQKAMDSVAIKVFLIIESDGILME